MHFGATRLSPRRSSYPVVKADVPGRRDAGAGVSPHHVQEEETEMLPKTRELLGAARLDEMGADFEAAKEEVS
jgi:hypothetical protein